MKIIGEEGESTGVGRPHPAPLWLWEGPLQRFGLTAGFQKMQRSCRAVRRPTSKNWTGGTVDCAQFSLLKGTFLSDETVVQADVAGSTVLPVWRLTVVCSLQGVGWGQHSPGRSNLVALRCGGVCAACLWGLKSAREKCVNCGFKMIGMEAK